MKKKKSGFYVCNNRKPKHIPWGAWVAQSEKHVILDLGVISSSPMSGVEITKKNKLKKRTFLKDDKPANKRNV